MTATPLTVEWPSAPLVEVDLAVDDVAVPLLVDDDPDVVVLAPVEVVVVAGVEDAEDAPDVVPPVSGAVVWPSIWLWTAGVKVPVMPSMVNFAENARAGYWVWVASLRARDSTRMKYSAELGPIEGSGVNWTEDVVLTSTLELILCNRVCCCALPA